MHDVPLSWHLTYILLHIKMYIIYLLSRPSSVAKSIGRALYLFLHSLLLFIFISNPNHFNYYYYFIVSSFGNLQVLSLNAVGKFPGQLTSN